MPYRTECAVEDCPEYLYTKFDAMDHIKQLETLGWKRINTDIACICPECKTKKELINE